MELTAGTVVARIDPAHGGRLASLEVAGEELLAPRCGNDDLSWGCYAMVPWAGRLRHGRFTFRGVERAVDVDLAPHAIHGLGYRAAWEVCGNGWLGLDLDDRWAFGGRAEQRFTLGADAVHLHLSITAGTEPMPAVLGWHPCLRRRLGHGAAAVVGFTAERMLALDTDGIPTGERVAPVPGPWDDCFEGITDAPELSWPGALSLRFESTCSIWVVYDRRDDMVCIEPQTDAPDAFNSFNAFPRVLAPGESLSLGLTIRWTIDRD